MYDSSLQPCRWDEMMEERKRTCVIYHLQFKEEVFKKMIQSVYNKTSIGSGEQRGSYTLENSRCGDGGDLLT